jgi:hypothetical protein
VAETAPVVASESSLRFGRDGGVPVSRAARCDSSPLRTRLSAQKGIQAVVGVSDVESLTASDFEGVAELVE